MKVEYVDVRTYDKLQPKDAFLYVDDDEKERLSNSSYSVLSALEEAVKLYHAQYWPEEIKKDVDLYFESILVHTNPLWTALVKEKRQCELLYKGVTRAIKGSKDSVGVWFNVYLDEDVLRYVIVYKRIDLHNAHYQAIGLQCLSQ